MIVSIFTSGVAYISTNIDDIFVIMILLAQAAKEAKGKLIAGHFLGVGIVTAISMLGALGLQNLPLKYVGILGLVPIGLGIKAWLDHKLRYRKSGTGMVRQISEKLWEGRYSPRDAHGKRIARNVYAQTEQECEEKLKVLIDEMKAEIKAEKALLKAQESGMTISM